MNAIKKVRNLQLGPSAMFALISVLALHAADAMSSAPPEALPINEAASVPAPVPPISKQIPQQVPQQSPQLDPSSLVAADRLNLAAVNQPSLIAYGPLSQALLAEDERYPYTEGSQLNRPSDMIMPATNGLFGLIPGIPETSTYAMLSIGLLGLMGARKWKRRVDADA